MEAELQPKNKKRKQRYTPGKCADNIKPCGFFAKTISVKEKTYKLFAKNIASHFPSVLKEGFLFFFFFRFFLGFLF